MNLKTYFNIEVPKRKPTCSAGQEVLLPGADFFSVITESDENCFSRSDYCSLCWKQVQENPEIRGAVTFWKSKVPEKEEPKEIHLDRDETALALLRQTARSEDEDERQQAFVLALYLARRRLITQRKEFLKNDQTPALLFEIAKTGEIIIIDKLSLSSLQVEKIQKYLSEKVFGYIPK